MNRIFKIIMGYFAMFLGVGGASTVIYKLIFDSSFLFEFKIIPQFLMMGMFIYYGWHWSKGIVFYNDETFLKTKDKYYKAAVLEAQENLHLFIRLLKEGLGVIYTKFKNYKGKIVRAEAVVESVDLESKEFKVSLIKSFNKELENDYTVQKISFSNLEDWIYSYPDSDKFEGGFIIKAKIKKADDKGYIFDYSSEPIIQYIRSNSHLDNE